LFKLQIIYSKLYSASLLKRVQKYSLYHYFPNLFITFFQKNITLTTKLLIKQNLNENVFLKFILEMIFYYVSNPFLAKINILLTFKKRISGK
jgi:hypothetical protein